MAKKIKIKKKAAAFTPEKRSKPICPECFSRPDIDWGRRTGPSSTPRGWDLSVEDEPIEIDGRKFNVTSVVYRCSNENHCATGVVVRTVLGEMNSKWGLYVPEDVESSMLRNKKAIKFLSGGFTEEGVWEANGKIPPVRDEDDIIYLEGEDTVAAEVDEEEVEMEVEEEIIEAIEEEAEAAEEEDESPEARFERVGPWLYIESPLVEKAPKPWTREKGTGRLKVRYGTDRYQQVWEWFFDHGLEIP